MTERALTYLHDLQQKCYAYLGVSPVTAREKLALVTSLDSKLKQLTSLDPKLKQRLDDYPLPTPLTDPFTYIILDSIRAEVKNAIETLSNTPQSQPILATLPTGRLNAMAIMVPSTDQFIIAFDDCVPLVVTAMSQAIIGPLYSCRTPQEGGFVYSLSLPPNEEGILTAIRENPVSMELFMRTIYPYLLDPLPRLAGYIPPENAILTLKDIFQTSMTMCLLGHEYAHVALHHLGLPGRRHVKHATVAGQSVEAMAEDWQEETQADALGFEAMLLAMNKRGNAPLLPVAAAHLLFAIFDILEKAVALVQSGDEAKRHCLSHPPSAVRREAIRQITADCLNQKTQAASLAIADVACTTADVLWKELRPFLTDGRNHGWKLARRWESQS